MVRAASVVVIVALALAGVPLRAEEFVYPLAVAAASDGTVYVADRMLPGIWRIKDGQTSVFARGEKTFRTPLNAIRGVAVAADGTVYAADPATREVYRITADGQPTPLTSGGIGIPVDIAVDAGGDLFVSDLETQTVWRVPAAGGEPKAVAVLDAPRGLFVDGDNRLWAVAASAESPLVRIAADGTVEPVVKTRAFEFPHDVVVAADGTAYVSDNYARTVWKVTADGMVAQWVADGTVTGPVGLAAGPGGSVLVADPQARAVFSVGPDAAATRLAP